DPLTISNYTLGKVLRYYQDVAIRKSIEAFLENKKRILLTMATGTGKTLVAFQIVWRLLKSGHINKVLFIADRTFLRDQAYNVFEPFGNARETIKDGQYPMNRSIFFTTYQSLFSGNNKKVYEQYEPNYFDFIIVDEAHRSGYGRWNLIFQRFHDAIHFGMTATPKREENIDTYAYFGQPVYTYSLGQGIDDGYLAPYKIHKVYTNIDKDGRLSLRQAQEVGANIYIPEGTMVKDSYTQGEFEEKITLPDRTKRMCEHLSDLLRDQPLDKTMIFCVNMEHAGQVAKDLQNHFSFLGYSDFAVRIVSEEMNAKTLIENFVDSDKITPVIATTVDLLSTGIDAPSVKNIVFFSPLSSKVFFKQIVGRGSRIDDITKKYQFRIIDYINATRLFDEWDFPTVNQESINQDKRNKFLTGIIVDPETGTPIQSASVTVQVGPNEQSFVRTNKDGIFSFSNLPSKIKIQIRSYSYKEKSIELESFESAQQSIIIELKKKTETVEKIIIDNLPVYISEEIKLEIADGRTLNKAQYIEYSKEEIRKRLVTLDDLKRIWSDSDKRNGFLHEIKERSVSPKVITDLISNSNTDTFDIIAHVAFDAPLITRDERVDAFQNMKSDFLNSLGPGKDIVLALLEKYRIAGIENIVNPKIYSTPPFDQMGYINGVVKRVGGISNLMNIIKALETGLYEEDDKR
ncbi:MAG TPA: DEAD/DEAH box helicase family protein, partial [Nitrososphaeraceae archaeon]|nr:DEAD/DEAH box helicase family protein [Nitrososphaeraceae archaeon]